MPEISAASTADIIFILLFFFMLTSVFHNLYQRLIVKIPVATELTKLQKKSLSNTILIGGVPKIAFNTDGYPVTTRLQLGGKISDISHIPLFLDLRRAKIAESQRKDITIIS